MNRPIDELNLADLPSAVAEGRRGWSFQFIWVVPIVAALIGGWLVVKGILEHGPTITITFKTAEGLEAGKTKIKYKNVDVGEVKQVTLSDDHQRVVATAEIVKEAGPYLVEDSRFGSFAHGCPAAMFLDSGRCSPAPSSGWISANPTTGGANSPASIRRRCSLRMSRAASSSW